MVALPSTGETEALKTITRLLRKTEWRDSQHAPALRAQLLSNLDAPAPHLRFLAVTALPVAQPNPHELATTLAALLDTEEDPDILTAALSVLRQAVPPELADSILAATTAARTAGEPISELVLAEDNSDWADVLGAWVVAHLVSALQAGTPHVTSTVRSWFSDPVAAGPRFHTAVVVLRDAFSFQADGPDRRKAFDLVRTAAAALHRALTAAPNDETVVLGADALIEQLYYASGAFEGSDTSPRPTGDQKTRWFTDAMPALEALTSVRHPHSCYQLLETFEFLIDEDPLRVFEAVAATIKDDSEFRFEQLGMSVTVRIINCYLAEHRHLFLRHPKALSELRRMLEVFATVGWTPALHLSYSLGEVFR